MIFIEVFDIHSKLEGVIWLFCAKDETTKSEIMINVNIDFIYSSHEGNFLLFLCHSQESENYKFLLLFLCSLYSIEERDSRVS
jgi:hypothetical protein